MFWNNTIYLRNNYEYEQFTIDTSFDFATIIICWAGNKPNLVLDLAATPRREVQSRARFNHCPQKGADLRRTSQCPSIPMIELKAEYMELAIFLGQANRDRGAQPIGAVIVRENEI